MGKLRLLGGNYVKEIMASSAQEADSSNYEN